VGSGPERATSPFRIAQHFPHAHQILDTVALCAVEGDHGFVVRPYLQIDLGAPELTKSALRCPHERGADTLKPALHRNRQVMDSASGAVEPRHHGSDQSRTVRYATRADGHGRACHSEPSVAEVSGEFLT